MLVPYAMNRIMASPAGIGNGAVSANGLIGLTPRGSWVRRWGLDTENGLLEGATYKWLLPWAEPSFTLTPADPTAYSPIAASLWFLSSDPWY